jgi:hypothetical protein
MGLNDDTAAFARFPAGTFPDDRLPLTLPFEKATQSEFVFSYFFTPFTREMLTDFSATIVPEPNAVVAAALLLVAARCGRRSRIHSCCCGHVGSSSAGAGMGER